MTATTTASGGVLSHQEFDPWGTARPGGGVSQTSLNYTGQRRDDTGLLYYHARYYDSALARWISPDSEVPDPSDAQDLNRYSYVHNSPLRFRDPTGHDGADAVNVVVSFAKQYVANTCGGRPKRSKRSPRKRMSRASRRLAASWLMLPALLRERRSRQQAAEPR